MLAQTHFHTNGLGLRGAEICDDASIRVLAIGDSCTSGWRVADDESYPARLQPVTEFLADQVLTLACFPEMTAGEVSEVILECNEWQG